MTIAASGQVKVSVLILSFNSEADIRCCLDSVVGWASEVFLIDAYSTDATKTIAASYAARIVEHEFEGFAQQRNWALQNLPISNEWILHLDADEALTQELADEIGRVLNSAATDADGFYLNRRFVWMGRWLRHGGYYPNRELRLFRRAKGSVIDAGLREYVTLRGRVGQLKGDMMHEARTGLSWWIEKHNRYSEVEALEFVHGHGASNLAAVHVDDHLEGRFRLRVREQIWNRCPGLMRAVLAFTYRYVVRLGFLDGLPGFTYCFLHDLWYPLLVDMKAREYSRSIDSSNG